jgi:CTP:molybdopterin cytidylyltransferase MocA
MTFALIPAGGKSARMGRPKLSLPLAGRTVLEHVIVALRQAGIERILVVVGAHVPELVPLASAAGAATLLLGNDTPDMRATVEQGLAWVEQTWPCAPADPWLLVPADHPMLSPEVVHSVFQAYQPPAHTIVIPTHGAKRGHPSLLAWKHVSGIRALAPGVGINAYFRQHVEETRELPVESADILVDLDTPEVYENLKRVPFR